MTADSPDSQAAPSRFPLLARPDGGRQVGVGPGARVLRSEQAGQGAATGDVLGPALAGLLGGDPALAGLAPPVRAGSCSVRGSGPLASRLRIALGDAPVSATAPVQVLVHQHVVPPEVGLAAAREGRPTVPVVVQHLRVLVGPVVGAGGGPCLHCLDLHRRDRDPAWPTLATALGHPVEQLAPLHVPDPLVRAVEGLVLLVVASLLAGRPVAEGLGHELGPVAPHVVVRRWTRHLRCPWHPPDAR